MPIGFLSIIIAAAAAIWLLIRMARGGAPTGEGRNDLIFRGVVFLTLVAALAAAKLWPLAFMVLIAAGAVMGIEIWRAQAIKLEEAMAPPPVPQKAVLKPEEAASILGVSVDASADDIRSAHKKLIAQLHPDKGGTDYLAAQINDARAVLIENTEKTLNLE